MSGSARRRAGGRADGTTGVRADREGVFAAAVMDEGREQMDPSGAHVAEAIHAVAPSGTIDCSTGWRSE